MERGKLQNKIENTYYKYWENEALDNMEDEDFINDKFDKLDVKTKYFISRKFIQDNDLFYYLLDSFIEQFYINQLEIDKLKFNDEYHIGKRQDMIATLDYILSVTQDEIYDVESYILNKQKDKFLDATCYLASYCSRNFYNTNQSFEDVYKMSINECFDYNYSEQYNIIEIIKKEGSLYGK